MPRAALAALLLALLSAPALGAAPEATAADTVRPEGHEPSRRGRPGRESLQPNAYELVFALLATAAGIGAFVWLTRRPDGGCGSPYG